MICRLGGAIAIPKKSIFQPMMLCNIDGQKRPEATYFFTVVTYQRQTIFDDAQMVDLLRQCFRVVKQRHPFVIETMVVLREHLHCLWTLPNDDADFSMRWRLIKSEFSRRCRDDYKRNRTISLMRKGEQAVWHES